MNDEYDVWELSSFLLEYATTLLGVGAPTSRVVRSVTRIAHSYGHGMNLAVFPKHIVMTVFSGKDKAISRTRVYEIKHLPFNFEVILRLNALSWKAGDNRLPLATLRARYESVIARPHMSRWLVLLLVACANASFCRLFGGDPRAMGMVFIATLAAFYIRQEMSRRHIDVRMVFLVCAFVASYIGSLDTQLGISSTPEVTLGASVLFLIPGIPLINAVHDTLEGFILMGIARAVNASILIACISMGLALTLLLQGVGSI